VDEVATAHQVSWPTAHRAFCETADLLVTDKHLPVEPASGRRLVLSTRGATPAPLALWPPPGIQLPNSWICGSAYAATSRCDPVGRNLTIPPRQPRTRTVIRAEGGSPVSRWLYDILALSRRGRSSKGRNGDFRCQILQAQPNNQCLTNIRQ